MDRLRKLAQFRRSQRPFKDDPKLSRAVPDLLSARAPYEEARAPPSPHPSPGLPSSTVLPMEPLAPGHRSGDVPRDSDLGEMLSSNATLYLTPQPEAALSEYGRQSPLASHPNFGRLPRGAIEQSFGSATLSTYDPRRHSKASHSTDAGGNIKIINVSVTSIGETSSSS
jgi:hypothetical protein